MMFHGTNNEQYLAGKVLGRGGEGTVYELQNDSGKVLKLYNEPLSPTLAEKLREMVAMRGPAIETYAAWPVGLAINDHGAVCGFIMKKLTGYVPLHMIFSPMDRKKMFPDKGYNFLVHVARNLATAFHKLHEAGLVVGDVNEGNILISVSGLVAFIDCDSFQVKGRAGYYYCEVGVPRYTPPELLALRSFEQVTRTVNTDSFSLAILIFQLLFLGRHPFAGKNRSSQDIDEETAIKMREFAYSLNNQKKKLLPPNDSFDINNLTELLITCFHRAFETDERPLPAEWIVALDGFLTEMVTCDVSRIHSYPAKMAVCPWCSIRKERGIMYFLDNSYLRGDVLLNDIDRFVNGFRIEKLELKDWSGDLVDSSVAARPLAAKWRKYRVMTRAGSLAIAWFFTFYSVDAGVSFASVVGVATIITWIVLRSLTPKVRKEKARLNEIFTRTKKQMEELIIAYNLAPDRQKFKLALDKLTSNIEKFRHLPDDGDRLRKEMEEQVYNNNLDNYLRQFSISDHSISSFGPAKKNMLLSAGVVTAADITLLLSQKTPGIGPSSVQVLLDWQRQMASGFVYIPDPASLAAGMQQVNNQLASLKDDLEKSIREDYQSLNYIKLNITNRALVLERQIKEAVTRNSQAKLDLEAFNTFFRMI